MKILPERDPGFDRWAGREELDERDEQADLATSTESDNGIKNENWLPSPTFESTRS